MKKIKKGYVSKGFEITIGRFVLYIVLIGIGVLLAHIARADTYTQSYSYQAGQTQEIISYTYGDNQHPSTNVIEQFNYKTSSNNNHNASNQSNKR